MQGSECHGERNKQSPASYDDDVISSAVEGANASAGAGLFANGDGCGRVMGCAFGCGSDIGYMCEGEKWISIR